MIACPNEVALWCGWSHWLRTVVLRDRRVVAVNMDETMVRHEYPSPSGNVVRAVKQDLRTANLFFQRSRGNQEKAGTTLLAMICDNEVLQPHLPQIWLPKDGPTKRMSHHMRSQLSKALADKYPQQVWGGTTGWMTAPLFNVVLRLLRQRVDKILGPEWLVLLIIDAAGAHTSVETMQLAAEMDMPLLLIPGQLTCLLQMLDVQVFWHLKHRLRQEYMQLRHLRADGRLPANGWVHLAVDAVHDTLVQRDWRSAFDVLYIPSVDVPLRTYCRVQALAPASVEDLPQMPMTPGQADEIMGRHRKGIYHYMFEAAIRVMPSADRSVLRDRLLAQEACELASASDPPTDCAREAPAPVPAMPPPADSIAGRVAWRRRSRESL